jgi:hypothetical protein
MLREARPDTPPRLVRKPCIRHLRGTLPHPTSMACQHYRILKVTSTKTRRVKSTVDAVLVLRNYTSRHQEALPRLPDSAAL